MVINVLHYNFNETHLVKYEGYEIQSFRIIKFVNFSRRKHYCRAILRLLQQNIVLHFQN